MIHCTQPNQIDGLEISPQQIDVRHLFRWIAIGGDEHITAPAPELGFDLLAIYFSHIAAMAKQPSDRWLGAARSEGEKFNRLIISLP